jgi:WD40 repeat protein
MTASFVPRCVVGLALLGPVVACCGQAQAWVGPPLAPPVQRDLLGDPLPQGAIARMGSSRLRHTDQCLGLLFVPNGKALISYGNPTSFLWDTTKGKELARYQSIVACSAEGSALQVGREGFLTLRDLGSGKELSRFKGPPTEKWGKQFPILSRSGRYLAIVLDDQTIAVYETKNGKLLRTLQAEGHNPFCLLFSPDETLLASGDFEDAPTAVEKMSYPVLVWDVKSGKQLHTLRGHQGGVFNLCFSPDSKTLLVTGAFVQAQVWEMGTGNRLPPLGHLRTAYDNVVFSPDGRTLAMRSKGVAIWELARRRQVRPLGDSLSFHYNSPLAFTPDGRSVAGLAPDGHWILLYDVATGREKRISSGHRQPVVRSAPSPTGKWVATASADGRICVWDTRSGRVLFRCRGSKDSISDLLVTPDGKTLIAGGGSGDEDSRHYTVRLWDATTGKEAAILTSLRAAGGTMALSANGKLLTVGNQDGVQFWNPMKREVSPFFADIEHSRLIKIAADGKTLAAVTRQSRAKIPPRRPTRGPAPELDKIELWDLVTGKRTGTLPHNSWYVTSLAFSPDGRMVAAGGGKDNLLIWDAGSRETLHEISLKPLWAVVDIAFSSDGKLMATRERRITKRTVVGIWEVSTAQKIAELVGSGDEITSVAFVPGTFLLVTASADGTAVVWDLSRMPEIKGSTRLLSDMEAGQLWNVLREPDARMGFRAVCRLVRSQEKAVAMIRKKLPPVPHRDVQRIKELIRKLDSGSYLERKMASGELRSLSPLADPELAQALKEHPSAEMRRRIRALLGAANWNQRNLETLGEVRAIQVLEQIGADDCRRVLQEIARGEPLAVRTREARAALERLAGRPRDR